MKRKLTEEAKKAIRRSFYERIDRWRAVQEQARVFADHTCDLLELSEEDTVGWWEPTSHIPTCGYTTEAGRWCDLGYGHEGEHNAKGPR